MWCGMMDLAGNYSSWRQQDVCTLGVVRYHYRIVANYARHGAAQGNIIRFVISNTGVNCVATVPALPLAMTTMLDPATWVNFPDDLKYMVIQESCSYDPHLIAGLDYNNYWPIDHVQQTIRAIFDTIHKMRSLSKFFYAACPFPPTIFRVEKAGTLEALFLAVIEFEQVFCRCSLSVPGSTNKHYPFQNITGISVWFKEVDNATELGNLARQATPFMTSFRA